MPQEGRFGRPLCSRNKFSTRLSGSSSLLSVVFHCQTEQVQMVVWMLQRRLLIQVCNIYLLQRVFMSTRTSLNAYCLKNSCVLSRVNYPHFIAYLRFTNLRRYIYISEVEIKASLDDFVGQTAITGFVIHSTYSSPKKLYLLHVRKFQFV